MIAAPALTREPTSAPAGAASADGHTDYDSQIAAAKQAMLGDPVRARGLGRAAHDAAAAWPAGRDREVAIATAEWIEGEGAYRANDVSAATPLIDAALKVAAQMATGTRLHADLLLSRGRLRRERGEPQTALADFQLSYNIYTRLHDPRGEAKALQSIGSIYLDAQDYNRVLYYYGQAEERAHSDSLSYSAFNNMALAYQNLGLRKEAQQVFEKSLLVARKLNSPLLITRVLANIGDLAIDDRDYRAAARAIAMGLSLSDSPAAAGWRPMLLGTRAKLDLAEGRTADAERDITAALARSDDATSNQSFGALQMTAYRVYRAVGDDRRALDHLEAFRVIDDKGRALASSTNAALMSARFDFANQNTRIATLKAGELQRDFSLARLRARQSIMIFSGVLILLVAILIGLFVYIRAVRRNRAEVMLANARLAQSNAELGDALQAKSQFLATTSHEIRTPLNGILGMTQVILADRIADGVLRERVALVDAAGRAMRTLVDDILDFAKMDSGAVRLDAAATDLPTIIPEIVSLWRVQAHAKGIELRLTMTGVDAPLMTDTGRLRQVVFNLLSNAIKFTADGTVSVDVRAEDGADGPTVAIAVADSGIGIPPEAFETIFEPFRQLDTTTTRQFGGTGLGLAISRHLARMLGGDISVSSAPGEGATFVLRLPYPPATVARVVAKPASVNVLVASANPIRRSFLRTALDSAIGPAAACDALEIAAFVGANRVGLIIVDVDDDESPALAERVLADLAAIVGRPPLVLLLPAALGHDRAGWLAAGAADVVVKPLRVTELAAMLRDLLEGIAANGAAARPVVFAHEVP